MFINWVKKLNNKSYKLLAVVLFVVFTFYNLTFYFTSYYIRFPVLYAKSWRLEDKDVALYIKENEYKYDRIIFDNKAGYIYSSLLFYMKYPPLDFQNKQVRYPDDSEGFSMIKSFAKYEFRDVDWPQDYKNKRTLIITTSDQKPNYADPLKTFYYPKRPVYFSVKQEVVGFPIEEIAYVLVETK